MSDICRWFALCDRPATTVRYCPPLGMVPCCERCASRRDFASQPELPTDPVGYHVDVDCDGLSVSFFDERHVAHRETGGPTYPYGEKATGYVTRKQFDELVAPIMDERQARRWKEEGYFNDGTGIANCETTAPRQPQSLLALHGIA